MGNYQPADPDRVPDIQFEPMASPAEVSTFIREDLDGKIKGLHQALLLATFDRPRLVGFLDGLDADEMMNVAESATAFAKWAKEMARLAEASATRCLIAMAEIADMLKPLTSDAAADEDPAAAEWTRYARAFRDHRQSIEAGAPYNDQHPHGVECDEADMALVETPAETLAGVEGKLRRLFMYHNREDWAADLALGVDNPATRQRLDLADLYDRILWSAVDDLQRISSVEEAA